jgi:GNAT superfamily N-acetyltransferase
MTEIVTTWYLQLLDQSEFIPRYLEDKDLKIAEVKIKDFRYNRFLYQLVGENWNWTDKLSWSDEQWLNYAEDKNLLTYVAYYSGTPAGYFELKKETEGNVKIEYFGLSPRFIGKGLGSHLLSSAIAEAWTLGATRIWVHTCSLDHPSALKNYQARGMKVYDVRTAPDD